MNRIHTALACALALAASVPAFAQSASEGSCILAGRLGDTGWAPRMQGVELLGQDGKAIASADKAALASVKQARLSAPALLSQCDGSKELVLGPDSPGPKAAVPAVGPGVVAVQAVSFPKLRRGGELVELRISAPAERVTLLTR
ncbi:hypothetical protein [uncultured Ramlibacter sp.]|uniref:hypothetical protein n=1 Tax=uncultured Ramlibacter sp. TaxID=260755 RepID=UPI00260D575C|nr:hypothetical protein [uncultured Ramlibacter sp.]